MTLYSLRTWHCQLGTQWLSTFSNRKTNWLNEMSIVALFVNLFFSVIRRWNHFQLFLIFFFIGYQYMFDSKKRALCIISLRTKKTVDLEHLLWIVTEVHVPICALDLCVCFFFCCKQNKNNNNSSGADWTIELNQFSTGNRMHDYLTIFQAIAVHDNSTKWRAPFIDGEWRPFQ